MKILAIATLSSTLFLAACGGSVAEEQDKSASAEPQTMVNVDKETLAAEAKVAVQTLGKTLKGELKQAMQAGGPENALDICHTRAPELAAEVSKSQGMQVSRVSLKNRNPVLGEPNAWQQQVLKDFEARKAAGEKPQQLVYAEVVEANDQHEFRFMKAIPTGEACLQCHGTDIKPNVMEKLQSLYPEDKATGFEKGDLRGAFVVMKSVAE